MRLSWNLFAGLINSAWTAIFGLIATPFYLRYLGVEAYGLIGFFTTLLAVMQLLDFGMSPAISREVARDGAGKDRASTRNLLRSLEFVYWGVAGSLGLAVFGFAGWLAEHWLQSTQLPLAGVTHAIRLMGLVLTVRWSISLYLGVLMGAQRLAIASSITILITTITTVGAILVLAFFSPTINAFFAWQAVMGLTAVLAMRWAAWRTLGGVKKSRFDRREVLSVWRFSAGLTGIAISGVVLSQLDKILLSRLVGLDGFGIYMLATTIAGGLYLVVTPIFNVMYPRFSALVAGNETERLLELYGLGTRFISTLLFSAAAAISLFARPLMQAWIGNPTLATRAAPLVSLLVVGGAIHGVMYFPYALQLAYGKPRLALMINAVLIVLMVPLTIGLTLKFGERGAAMAWLMLHVVYLIVGTGLTHRVLLKGHGVGWIRRDVGIPFCAALIVAATAHSIPAIRDVSGAYSTVICASAVALSAALVSLTLSPALQSSIRENLGIQRA